MDPKSYEMEGMTVHWVQTFKDGIEIIKRTKGAALERRISSVRMYEQIQKSLQLSHVETRSAVGGERAVYHNKWIIDTAKE